MLRSEIIKLETLRLFQDYRESASFEVRNQIVQLNFGLVRKEAYHWMNKCNESYEDLLQVGSMGLIRSIDRFNVQKGNSFSSFAIPYIRGEIRHYIRDKGYSVKIPRRWLDIQRQSAKVIQQFETEFDRQPTDLEIAERLDISWSEWQEIKLAYQNRAPISLDASLPNDESGKMDLGALVTEPRYRSFQLAQEDQIRLELALDQLEERTRKIVEFVFLHDLTYKETAQILNVSVVTISRQLKKGINLLKQFMGTE